MHVFAQVVLGSFLEDHLCCHKCSSGPFMLVINGPHYVLQGSFMFMYKWSCRTKYNRINGPPDHLCSDHLCCDSILNIALFAKLRSLPMCISSRIAKLIVRQISLYMVRQHLKRVTSFNREIS